MHGAWYTLDDVDDCPIEARPRPGTVSPPKGIPFTTTPYDQGEVFPAELDAPNEAGLRIWGDGHTLWGALLGTSFDSLAGTPLPYDLTKTGATGIRFWARSAAGDLSVRVKLQDKWSEPSAVPMQCCFLDPNVCGASSCGLDEQQGCFDAPWFDVRVGAQWQLFEISFASFARFGFGTWVDGLDHRAEPPALNEVYQLQFELDKYAEPFDVYFDNIGLIVPE